MRKYDKARAELIKEAEEEFGEPFWDIVRGFAADGYASGTTGKILGFSGQMTFKRLQDREGVVIDWPAHGQCLAMTEPRGEYTKERADKRLAFLGLKRKVKKSVEIVAGYL